MMPACIECGNQAAEVVYDEQEKCYLCRECYVNGMVELVAPKIKEEFDKNAKERGIKIIDDAKRRLLSSVEMRTRCAAVKKFSDLRAAQIKKGLLTPPQDTPQG